MKNEVITLEKAKDIANRYFHCQKRIKHCVSPCSKCKYNYTPDDVDLVMEFVLKIDKSSDVNDDKEKNNGEI